MKKIMVYAYTHFNLGDDLFIKILCERYPQTIFELHAPSAYKHLQIKNLRYFPSDSIIIRGINYIYRRLHINNFSRQLVAKSCDAAVHIGGSLFIQSENWHEDLKNTKAMRSNGKPFFLLGANFGPFHDQAYYLEHKEIFKEYTDICFREKHSYELFEELDHVRLADDIVFQLVTGKIQAQREKSIVISVIKPSIREDLASYDELYYAKITEIAIHFINKGYDVTLMSFCQFEGDHEAIKMIMKLIPASHVNQIKNHLYTGNIEETLDTIATSRFVVATRFHAMILAWLYNKPVYPIVYSNKMTHVIEDIGFNDPYTEFDQLHTLTAEQVFRSINTNPVNISKQIKSAEKQFEKLDAYLL